MPIQEQVHDMFKIFVGDSVSALDKQVREFSKSGEVACKSIGIECLESTGQLVLSLGYRQGGGYQAGLSSKKVGMLDTGSEASLKAIETALTDAAASMGDVICHELYVTASGEVDAVFMVIG